MPFLDLLLSKWPCDQGCTICAIGLAALNVSGTLSLGPWQIKDLAAIAHVQLATL
jgi:hypothetical protein